MNVLRSSLSVFCVLRGLANEAVIFLRSCFHSRTALIAENLFLRKQLTFYQEHQVRPRRLTNAPRLSLVFWSRFFEWKSALLIVKPATLIGWHRKAFRLFWKWKSRRVGRPRLPAELQQMIARMVHDNPTWGEERIADELWLKLGISVSPRTVRAYWPTEDKSRPSVSRFAELEDVCPQSCPRPAGMRLHGRGHRALPYPLYIRGDGDRLPPHPSLQCDRPAHGRLDDATAQRSDPERSHIPLPYP